jgi:signal transduction histidine kinase
MMTEVRQGWNRKGALRYILFILLMTTLPFGLFYGKQTGNYLVSFGISGTISVTLLIIFTLDYWLLRPRLLPLKRDYRLILEITFAVVETITGALFAFWLCSRLFGIPLNGKALWTSVAILFSLVLIIRSIRYASEFYRDLKAKEMVEEQLRTLKAQAELKALKAQINPHFLFNTLNTIATLTHSDPSHAEVTIERLAEMFRYVLVASERGQVTLADELAFVDDYLEIERARFGDRLQITRQIGLPSLDILVPSLILQPLVENAIRHGQDERGRIDLMLRLYREDGDILIQIADHGPGMPAEFDPEDSKGVGLRNVDARLKKIYGEDYGLQIEDNVPNGTVFMVRIPWTVGEDSEEVVAVER